MRRATTIVILLLIFVIIMIIKLNSESYEKMIYPLKYEHHILNYASKYDLDPNLVAAVIMAESSFRKDAVSHKEARGLMQITPETGRWIAKKLNLQDFDEDMLFDPDTNIEFGCWYINNLRLQFGEDITLILAAYNGGRGNVVKWLNSRQYSNDGKTLHKIPYTETRNFVEKTLKYYVKYKELYNLG